MKPDADLMQPLQLHEREMFGGFFVMLGPDDEPGTAQVTGCGRTRDHARENFLDNLREAMEQGTVVILRDLPS